MFCSKCGVQNTDEAKFCKGCGQPLGSVAQTVAHQEHEHAVVTTVKPQKNIILYALAPVGVFILMFVLLGILNLLFGSTNSSPVLTFVNGVVIPLVIALSILAIPIGVIYAIYSNSRNFDGTGVIKCGNCNYVGVGKNGRRPVSQILAWMAIIIAWPITALYYAMTPKYLCPKCGSSFVGVRNKQGAFTAPGGGGVGWVVTVLIFLIVIAVVGILSSVVLASLNTARAKGADAAVKSSLMNYRAQAEVYYDSHSNSYTGFCNTSETKALTNSLSETSKQKYTCNDSVQGFAASLPLSSGKYYCVDNTGAVTEIETTIGTNNSCAGSVPDKVSWEEYNSSVDAFSINFPTKPTVETQTVAPTVTSPIGYSYRTYTASDGKSSFYVIKYNYSGTIDVSDPETLLKKVVSNISNGGQLISSSYSKQSKYPEVEFQIKINDEMGKGKTILVGQNPFLIVYDYLPINYNETDYGMFINSFKVN